MPLRKLLISGIPDPAASGSSHTRPLATVTYDRLKPSMMRNARQDGPVSVCGYTYGGALSFLLDVLLAVRQV